MLTNESALQTLGWFCVPSLCANVDISPRFQPFLDYQRESALNIINIKLEKRDVHFKTRFICLFGNCPFVLSLNIKRRE